MSPPPLVASLRQEGQSWESGPHSCGATGTVPTLTGEACPCLSALRPSGHLVFQRRAKGLGWAGTPGPPGKVTPTWDVGSVCVTPAWGGRCGWITGGGCLLLLVTVAGPARVAWWEVGGGKQSRTCRRGWAWPSGDGDRGAGREDT